MSAEAVARPALGSDTPLRFLPKAIRVPENPLKAIAFGWLTAFPISVLLAVTAGALMPHVARPEFPVSGTAALLGLVIFSPIVETVTMGLVLLVLLRFLQPVVAIGVSAIGWGIVHSLLAPTWGLVIWWPFLIFSTLFTAWRGRSLALAFALPTCVHALQNLLPAILVANGIAA